MCMWFWGYPPIIFITFFHFFGLVFFPGPISIRIDILWAQLLLNFFTDHLETMHTCFTWSEDVRVVLGLSSHYFLSTFFPLFCLLSCFQVQLVLEKIPCGRNSFSTYHFETMHIYSVWSEDVRVISGLSSCHTDLKVTTLYWQSHEVGGRLPARGFYCLTNHARADLLRFQHVANDEKVIVSFRFSQLKSHQ